LGKFDILFNTFPAVSGGAVNAPVNNAAKAVDITVLETITGVLLPMLPTMNWSILFRSLEFQIRRLFSFDCFLNNPCVADISVASTATCIARTSDPSETSSVDEIIDLIVEYVVSAGIQHSD
jgi:hypothetical protein